MAIDVALRFAADRQGDLGDVEVEATRERIRESDVWAVKLRERRTGDDAWMEIDWKPVSYFVDDDGLVIGFATERSTTMLR
ncbi:hypothetical protein [Sphingomonas sp. CFBP 8760]|uniref:hypothetical protein n=1 Tax=Sphingomonas sp. CFBP 8760 TaxID=2775282 RepID=UPI001781F6BB|nr:hypothetical protein [Sphingomonas sp. CFBP 8760]MBD8548275.1 hypothetical protein [Sphingomonas sp. CFBP 8760]